MDDLKSAKWELADFVSFIELSDELVGKHAARPKGFSSERTVYHNFRSKDTTAIDFRIWRILLKKSADSPMGAGVRRDNVGGRRGGGGNAGDNGPSISGCSHVAGKEKTRPRKPIYGSMP